MFNRAGVTVEGTPRKGPDNIPDFVMANHAMEAVERSVKTLISDVDLLNADVELLKAEPNSDSVKFSALGFKSVRDCDAWAKENLLQVQTIRARYGPAPFAGQDLQENRSNVQRQHLGSHVRKDKHEDHYRRRSGRV